MNLKAKETINYTQEIGREKSQTPRLLNLESLYMIIVNLTQSHKILLHRFEKKMFIYLYWHDYIYIF